MPLNALTRHRLVGAVDGHPIPALEADTHHHVDRAIGTANVTLPLPLPDRLRGPDDRVLNRSLVLQAGFDGQPIRTIFSGRIDGDSARIDPLERTATIRALGWATLLDWKEETDLIFAGPVALHSIIRSLCRWRGVPSYRVDPITDVNGQTIYLGGNPHVDEGNVRIPRRTSPRQWIERKCRLFGYRLFDTPSGEVRVQRISGQPTSVTVATYGDGINAYSIERGRALSDMVTYWTVTGPTYNDADGVAIPIESFPLGVPPDPLLTPPGYRADDLSDNDLVTLELAHAVRAVYENDRSLPRRDMRWEARGDSLRQPGEVVRLVSAPMDVDASHWLTGVDHRFDADEFVTTYGAWRGGTTSLPPGDDAVYLDIPGGPWHVGDEYLDHYRVPVPGGSTITIPFTVPGDFTSIAISGWLHGANSYLIGGVNEESTVSRIELWQGGDKAVGSAQLPSMPENLLAQLDYRDDEHWEFFRMPIPGKPEPGTAELRLVAGEDSRASLGPRDDFELRDPRLEFRGVGQPILPTTMGGT